MGQTTVRVENRACATCKNWKGTRSIEKLGSARVVRCMTDRQPCGKKPGSLSIPGSNCGSWEKWSRI